MDVNLSAHQKAKITRDLAFIALSMIVAAGLVVSGASSRFLLWFGEWSFLGAFLAGIGFSSAFFAAPATITIFLLAKSLPFWMVVMSAAVGAVIGDWIVFRFLRDGIAEDFRWLLEHAGARKRLSVIVRSRLFYWLGTVIAGLIIASPLPDEIGIAIFGVLRFDTKRFLPISFALNFLGILLIALLARLSGG